MGEKMNNRGQIAIWIILALVIVASILVLLAIKPKIIDGTRGESIDPRIYISSCARQVTLNTLDEMMIHGGFTEPSNVITFKGTNVDYICKNTGNYQPCINQHPLLLREMREELISKITPEIESCFDSLKDELESSGAKVSVGEMNIDAEFAPDLARIHIERELTVEEDGGSKHYETFEFEFVHPVYDLVKVVNEIASQEAKYCSFEYIGYMLLYPDFDIRIAQLPDSNKIYTIQDIDSQKTMNVAIRSCAIPGGL